MSMNFKPTNPQRGNKDSSLLPFGEAGRGFVENNGVEPLTFPIASQRDALAPYISINC